MKEIKACGSFSNDGKENVADSDKVVLSNWWNEGWLPITDSISVGILPPLLKDSMGNYIHHTKLDEENM
jgi:hypothetical protein